MLAIQSFAGSWAGQRFTPPRIAEHSIFFLFSWSVKLDTIGRFVGRMVDHPVKQCIAVYDHPSIQIIWGITLGDRYCENSLSCWKIICPFVNIYVCSLFLIAHLSKLFIFCVLRGWAIASSMGHNTNDGKARGVFWSILWVGGWGGGGLIEQWTND